MLKLRVNSTGAVYNAQNMFHNFILLRIYIIYIGNFVEVASMVRKELEYFHNTMLCYFWEGS